MRNITLLLFIICSLLVLNACFFKSDKTGTADDIISELLYTDNAGSVLIAHEKVFHATNKRSRGGITNISGYATTRLSTYDVNTGQLLARTILGKETEDGAMVLTLQKDRLWVLFKDEEVQLQVYDPRTLAAKAGTEELLQQAPFLKGHLASPEWYELKQFFGYDAGYGIILSDDKGFRYTLDPATLKVEKFEKSDYVLFFLKDPPATAMRGIYNDGITLSLNGNPRRTLEQANTPLPNKPSYLQGSFLIDNNVNRLKELQSKELAALNEQIAAKTRERDSMQAITDKLPAGSPQQSANDMKVRTAGYRIDDLVRKSEKITPHHMPGKTDQLLQPDPDQFFILQASSTNKDATLVLSQLEWKPGQDVKEKWQAPVTGMFFDPNNARETNNFKVVFSSGNPQFGFKWADITGQQLLLTWMLHTSCIDIKSGKVLWQIRH
jgi:hypothetical protein